MLHEKRDAMLEVDKLKSMMNNLIYPTSSSNACMHNDELNQMRKQISSLDSALNICIANNKKLMDLCAKFNVNSSKKPIHYAHMYDKIHKCSICGLKGHLAQFCHNAQKIDKPIHDCASH